jgi:dTDP-4-amino-4,6-dideoxygalactose transaminase
VAIAWARPEFDAEEERAVVEVMRSGRVTMGPRVRAFEDAVARVLGVEHAVAVSSGTAALDVALKALRLGPGDEVVVPALTYVATVNAVTYQGARPVPVDVDPLTFNLDPDAVRAALTPRTRCIVAIDYGGDSADYAPLEAISREAGVHLLQDAAHTFGGSYRGRPPGAIGVGATLSFHAAKLVTTVEGGMFVTRDPALAELARALRNQGEPPGCKYEFRLVGHNYRLSDLHAAIGLVQLGKMRRALDRRRWVAHAYAARLAELPGLRLPAERAGIVHPWFLYSVGFATGAQRDRVERALTAAEIETRVCWPAPVHRLAAYSGRLSHPDCPNAEAAAARLLSLPMHTALREDEIERVCETVRRAVDAEH